MRFLFLQFPVCSSHARSRTSLPRRQLERMRAREADVAARLLGPMEAEEKRNIKLRPSDAVDTLSQEGLRVRDEREIEGLLKKKKN